MWGGRRHLGHVSGGCGCAIRGGAGEDGQPEEKGAEDVAAAEPYMPRYPSHENPGARDGRVRRSHRPPLRVLIRDIAEHQSFSDNEFLNDLYSFIIRRNRDENPPTKGEVLDMLKRKLQFRFFADTVENSNELTNVNGAFFTANIVGHRLLTNYTLPLKLGMSVGDREGSVQKVVDVTTAGANLNGFLTGDSFTIANPGTEVTRPGVEGNTTIRSVDIANSKITLAHAVDRTERQMEFVLHGNQDDVKDVLLELFMNYYRYYRNQADAKHIHVVLILYCLQRTVAMDRLIRDNLFRYDGAQRFVRAIEDLAMFGDERIALRYLMRNHLSNLTSSVVETTPEEDQHALDALQGQTDMIEWSTSQPRRLHQLKEMVLKASTQPFFVADVSPDRVARSLQVLPPNVIALHYKYWNDPEHIPSSDVSYIRNRIDENTLQLHRCRLTGNVLFSYDVKIANLQDYGYFYVFSKAFNHYMRERRGAASERDAVNFALLFFQEFLQPSRYLA